MEAGAALAAGVVVVGALLLLARRRGTKESRSVAGYRDALDVLGRLGASPARPPARSGLAGTPPRPRLRRARAAGPALAGGSEDRPRATPGISASHVEPAPDGDRAHSAGDDRLSARRAKEDLRRTRRALAAMGRPDRRLGARATAGVLVLAVAAAAVYVEVRGRHGPAAASRRRTSSQPSARSQPPAHSVTSTTAPRSYAALASSPTGATYAPASATYSVAIDATTGTCWVSVTSGGTTLLAQTFAPGASASVSVSGASTVVLGAPQHASVSIGGIPLDIPKGLAGPFTLTLSPR